MGSKYWQQGGYYPHLVDLIQVLLQIFLDWQLAFYTLLRGRNYSLHRTGGCFLVVDGIVFGVMRMLKSL